MAPPELEDLAGLTSIMKGRKDDSGKPDWTLFPFDGAVWVVRVLEYGARKYSRDNWRSVPDAVNRYKKAAFRHMIADLLEENDESGYPHLAHAACSLLFALALKYANKKV